MSVPYDELDPPVVELVRALNDFPGITTTSSCGGHPGGTGEHSAPEGCWWVMFDVDEGLAGKLSLEFLAWAINRDGARAGSSVTLLPSSPPPFLNTPGRSLYYAIEGDSAHRPKDEALALARWLTELREECYVDAAEAEQWDADDDEDSEQNTE